MEVEPTPTTPKPSGDDVDKMDEDSNVVDTGKEEGKGKEKEATSTKKKVEKEKVGYELENMSRVLPGQIKYISFPEQGRYLPVKKVWFSIPPIPPTVPTLTVEQPTGGPILVLDTQPDEEKTLLELKAQEEDSTSSHAVWYWRRR